LQLLLLYGIPLLPPSVAPFLFPNQRVLREEQQEPLF